jgi:hypothetical protein
MNYIISNLRKPSDYDKAAMTQDQLLNIAIRNDANIAKARNDIKIGLPPVAPTPQQDKSPEELQADLSKQYSDAITNLQSLGFNYSTSGNIASQLEPDELVSFNQTYPAIDKDIKSRFNPKLITPTFFLEYLRQYLGELMITKGLSASGNLSVISGKFNGMIDSINELKSIFPSTGLIRELRKKFAPVIASLNQQDAQLYINELNALEDAMPNDQLYAELENLQLEDPDAFYNYIQKLQTNLADVPTTTAIARLVRKANLTQDDLDAVVDSISRSQEKALGDIYDQLGVLVQEKEGQQKTPLYVYPASVGSFGINTASGLGDIFYDKNDDGNWEVQTTPQLEQLYAEMEPSAFKTAISNTSGKKLKQSELRNYIRVHSTSGAVSAAAIAKVGKQAGTPSGSSQSSPRSVSSSSSSAPTAMGSAFNASATATSGSSGGAKRVEKGRGINLSFGSTLPVATNSIAPSLVKTAKLIRGKNDIGSTTAVPQPLQGVGVRTKKIGTGIRLEKEPSYKEFGKYCIHMPQLLNKDVLNVKYHSLGGIPDFKPLAISENYKDLMVDLLTNNKLNHSLYKQLPLQEKKHFEKVSIGAGIFNKLGISKLHNDDDKKELERFELVRGEIEAGNDNPKLLKEMKHFVIKFLNDGKITKQTAFNLLLELSV